ncbi:RNA polymerase sigma-70 factor (ECF subfamily) [Filimonas zeae]|uniref:DNA-directed RNA polymerase sigma-70 factor n=1 Tax=Filimonas zeae TaxID=1737353 RepID=A0A917IZB5_9BACT|nr:sigma-70 family RNA polymerase sigma factor [Filimonas zeae]MDR6338855.1 RNA polymerase sigma-70 factor (ECF subfamily) [Filimonas zeae]GGH66278.1 DNA-directed RNA polymerase sigma-70 factor [Filimonas zeae]
MQYQESFPGEQALVQRLKEGYREDFDELFNQYAEPVMNYLRFRLTDEQDAEDVLQEVFIKLWRYRHAIEIHTSFKNYLYTLVQNCINDHLRVLKRKRHISIAELPDSQEEQMQPDDHFRYRQLNQSWREAIQRLPVQMGRIYSMKNEEALSVKEIASELDLSEQTVKNQLHNAAQRIVKILQQVQLFFWALLPLFDMN